MHTLPCPSHPQPPGFLDLAAPHPTSALWWVDGACVVVLLWLGIQLFTLRRRALRLAPGPHPKLSFWLENGSQISAALVCLAIGLDLLWLDALRQWANAYPGTCTAVTRAYSNALQSQQTSGAITVGGFALLTIGLPKFVGALLRRTRVGQPNA